MEVDDEVPTAPWWQWLFLIAVACASFWCQASVTEERLVPALNTIAEYFNIPDDIAGATMMAAGASSPELFSSIIALFVTHSSLGLGTIVGSEIFNQLVICAGAVYASRNGTLQLDRAIVAREVGFYALSIVLLFIALQDHGPVDYDDVDHVIIDFWEALMLFSGYLLYVIVCANFDTIVSKLSSGNGATGGETQPLNHVVNKEASIDESTMKYIVAKKVLSKEPVENWKDIDLYMDQNDNMLSSSRREDGADMAGSLRSESSFGQMSKFAGSLHQSVRNLASRSMFDGMLRSERPSNLHSLYDLETNDMQNRVSCFMWQKSLFYSQAYYAANAWQLRWFTITPESVLSLPDRSDADDHEMRYPKFTQIEVDESHHIIKIINPNPKKRNYTLMAPNKSLFAKAIDAMKAFMENNMEARGEGSVESIETPSTEAEHFEQFVELTEFPSDGLNVEIFFWLLLSPIRYLMHYTIPDVRHLDSHGNPKHGVGYAFLSTFACILWLIVGSYCMVASLETLAELLNIPDSVIGVTVSAAGTSLPNYVASQVAVKAGYGNQAVSNAFGSNTFNIMVGLGLPWLLYTSIGTGFEPYSGLREEGIVLSISLLAAALLIFIVLMFMSGFVLHTWHGHLFFVLYAAYIVFSIAQVYI